MKPVIDLIVGARPNLIKLAPVLRAIRENGKLETRIVHTGQHYDLTMSDVFFDELEIPQPDVHFNVGSAIHGVQTARILERYEAELLRHRPAATVVFGDVNSTVACALAAVKLGVPVAHVEAGLRSFDRSMPEEINRVVTDAVADLLLASEPSGMENLRREGIAERKLRLVGNVMLDTLAAALPKARSRHAARALGLAEQKYGFITLHRPSNVDAPASLEAVLDLFQDLAREVPLVFAVHPRTLKAARDAGLADRLSSGRDGLMCVGPQAYVDTLSLVSTAALVLTDSGGLQEETSFLGVPCLTMRENTERPITIELGTSRLVGKDPARIRVAFSDALSGRWRAGRPIPLWDGQAGPRIADALADWLGAATT